MTVKEIIDGLLASLVSISVDGDKLVLDPLFPYTTRSPPSWSKRPVSSCPSRRLRYTDVTASEEWSRNRLTSSTDSPASLRSFAAACRKTWTPAGGSPACLKYPCSCP